ncbi:hypothetical protein RJ639_043685 [Escallonia herrerae]|uniref:Retrotransposon gag domain-containing protein n=1 Tax=Escallonia herrerae TaxID=1293975 RepID=A0AA89B0K9_9ASTE|nr:hypothetical protein RJ639_043685 [Escallonia herrerae]
MGHVIPSNTWLTLPCAYMHMHLILDQIMCHAFPLSLKDGTHVWFQHIPPCSISCWVQLVESFHNNFLVIRVQHKNSAALFHVVQGSKESLKFYYAWRRAEKLLIDNLDPGVTFVAMARGVKPGLNIVKRPKLLGMPTEKRDPQMCCHKDHGHMIENCKLFQHEIENLITQGYLKQFIETNERQ